MIYKELEKKFFWEESLFEELAPAAAYVVAGLLFGVGLGIAFEGIKALRERKSESK